MARPNSSDGKTEATLVRMCHAYGSGQPPADPYGYVEEAGGTRLRVVQRRQGADDFVGAVENLCIIRASSGTL